MSISFTDGMLPSYSYFSSKATHSTRTGLCSNAPIALNLFRISAWRKCGHTWPSITHKFFFWWGSSGERAFITILVWTLHIFYFHCSLFNTWNHELSHRYVCISETCEEWFLYILLLYLYRSLCDINYFCIYYTFLFAIKSFMRQKEIKTG